jgi:hypothetical protein
LTSTEPLSILRSPKVAWPERFSGTETMMQPRGLASALAALLALAGCGNRQNDLAGLTKDSHSQFPITSGVHALGASSSQGAITCESCHAADAPSFRQFTCVDCHEHVQPVTDRLHTSVKDYAYASAQCLSCHPSGAKAPFSHVGITSDCAQCHGDGTPYAPPMPPGFTHPAIGGADCGACHNTTDWKTAGTLPSGKSHDAKMDVVVNALVPTYSGSRIASLSPQSEHLPMSMDHTSTEVAQAAMSACTNCHASVSAGSYYPGTLHTSLAALAASDHTITQPKACASCHSDAMPVGFVGPNATAPARNPSSGEMKHDAVAWANGKPTTTKLVAMDCGLCHASPQGAQGSWATGTNAGAVTYHAALEATGSSQPSSCIDCHANSQPDGLTNSTTPTSATTGASTGIPAGTMAEINHVDINVSGHDCNFCHTQNGPSTKPGVQGKEWAQASFHSKFNSATNPLVLNKTTGRCSTCHLAEKPGAAYTQQNHSAFTDVPGSDDCGACHNTTDWKTASAVPVGKSRDSKMDVVVNALIPTYSGTRITNLTPQSEHLPMSMDHTSTDVAQAAMSTCANCHASASAGSYYPGTLHKSLATQPKACASCHSDATPVGFVGPNATAPARSPSSGEMKHDAVAWSSGKPTTTALVSTECGLCHASPAGTPNGSWAIGLGGGVVTYHAALDAAKLAEPSSCVDCHANSQPDGTTSSTTATSAPTGSSTGIPAGTLAAINHGDVNVTGHDCNFCHTQNGPSTKAGVQGKEWAQASFHANFTSAANPLVMNKTTGRCSTCHLAEKPGAAYTAQDHSAFTGASGSDDCSSCHTFPGTGTVTAPNWLGASGVPTVITVGGFPIPQPPATSTTTQAGIPNLPHPSVSAGVSCTTCHSSATGGKQAIGYDHKSTLINSNCNACHEAGSNLVGTKWNGATSQSAGAGDTRPFTIVGLVPAFKGNRRALTQDFNHFFAVDCYECHLVPSGNGLVTTGSAYTSAWKFDHNQRRMARSTCNMCHGSPNNLPGD